MKPYRIVTLLLCLAMILPCLAACGGGGEEETRKSIVVNEDSPLAQWAAEQQIDFGGENIVISLSRHTSAQITDLSTQFIEGPDKITSDSVQNKVMERNEAVATTIGINPRYVYTNLAFDDVKADVEQKIMTPGKDTPDLYIDQVYGMLRAQYAGYFHNAIRTSDTDKSYIDLANGGWYTEYMEAFNFGSDERLYMLAGDYFMDVLRFMNLMSCNLSLFEELFTKQGGTKLLYDSVRQGAWTYDLLTEWCEAAFKDEGTTKGKADENDRLGMLSTHGGPPVLGFLPSMGISMYEIKADGSYAAYPGTDKRSLDAVQATKDILYNSTGVFFNTDGANDTMRATFVRGKALFMTGTLLCQLESEEFRSMQSDKCVLPYPKLYENDTRYYVSSHDNARVGAILVSSTKRSAVTAWLQAMALTSEEVRETYYEGALKFKYGADAGTTRLLDTIYESICAPYWIHCNAIPQMVGVTITKHPTDGQTVTGSPNNTYASDYAASRNALTEAIRLYMKEFNNLK